MTEFAVSATLPSASGAPRIRADSRIAQGFRARALKISPIEVQRHCFSLFPMPVRPGCNARPDASQMPEPGRIGPNCLECAAIFGFVP
jgi:hypothetical protein